MTPTFSIVTTCKGRLEHLKTTLPRLMALADCEVVVVDYDCPESAGDWVRASYPGAVVVQVRDQPLFNLAKARNLGVAASGAPWLVLLDADVIVSPGLAGALRDAIQPGAYLLPNPRPAVLWGALVVARENFDAIGGYDEVFEGWGWEDVDITARLDDLGLTIRTFDGGLLSSVPHGNDLRGQFHEIGDLNLNGAVNALYRRAKADLARHKVSLDPQQARDLYAGVRAALTGPGAPSRLNVALPKRTLAQRSLEVTITYRLAPFEPAPDDQA